MMLEKISQIQSLAERQDKRVPVLFSYTVSC